MKKFMLIVLASLISLGGIAAVNGDDRPIEYDQLPAKAKEFLTKYFPNDKVSYAKVDEDFISKEYEVILVNSSKVEFYGDGSWKEVNCKYTSVPTAIIPEPIIKYLETKFPGRVVVEIEKKKYKYEVKLDSSMEIEFDNKFNVIDIDY